MGRGYPGAGSSGYQGLGALGAGTSGLDHGVEKKCSKEHIYIDLGILKSILSGDECDNDRQGTLVLEKGFGRVSGVVGPGTCGISAGFGVV
jgi:hypothetical protein